MNLRFDRTILRRVDRSLALDLASPREVMVGGLIVEGRAARVHPPGDPLEYPHGDEHRDSAELDRIVAQLRGRPVLLDHPAVPFAKCGQQADGWITGARRDGDHAIVEIRIDSSRALRAVRERTHVELSLGYECRIDAHGFQRDTRVDHLALVSAARCGSSCTIRVDCGCDGRADADDPALDSTARRRRELARQPLPSDAVGRARAAAAAAGAKPWQQPLPSTVLFKETPR